MTAVSCTDRPWLCYDAEPRAVPSDRPGVNNWIPAGWTLQGTLPDLDGTARQIAWARRIRAEKLSDLMRELAAMPHLIRHVQRTQPDYQPSVPIDTWSERATAAWGPVLAQRSAAWWIDRHGWWVMDLRREGVERDGRLLSVTQAAAIAASALRAAAEADHDPSYAEEVEISGIMIGSVSPSGLPPRARIRIGVTGAGAAHQRRSRGWARRPVDVDFDGSMRVAGGTFLPDRGELDRVGICW